jgi:pyruvate, water dikinase
VTSIIWLDDVGAADAVHVGRKAAALGQLLRRRFPVSTGFVVTGDAYRCATKYAGVDVELAVPVIDEKAVGPDSRRLQQLLRDAGIPVRLGDELLAGYRELGDRLRQRDPMVAVRPSVIGHDGCYAGTRAAVIDVRGGEALLEAVTRVWMSLYDERALASRAAFGLTDVPAMAVIVQAMVPVVRSGTAFSVDPVRRRDDVVRVEAVFGRGEFRPTGPPASDSYLVCRGTNEVIESSIGAKTVEVVGRGSEVRTLPLPEARRHTRVLSDHEAGRIAEMAVAVEAEMGAPQHIHWCLGPTGLLEVLWTRPISIEPYPVESASP